jgi:hypothetical protein
MSFHRLAIVNNIYNTVPIKSESGHCNTTDPKKTASSLLISYAQADPLEAGGFLAMSSPSTPVSID